jgi:hypothetical protein
MLEETDDWPPAVRPSGRRSLSCDLRNLMFRVFYVSDFFFGVQLFVITAFGGSGGVCVFFSFNMRRICLC